jgi:hypothetical protein
VLRNSWTPIIPQKTPKIYLKKFFYVVSGLDFNGEKLALFDEKVFKKKWLSFSLQYDVQDCGFVVNSGAIIGKYLVC